MVGYVSKQRFVIAGPLLLLILLAGLLPPTQVFAAPSISLDSAFSPAGTGITVQGSGWPVGDQIGVQWQDGRSIGGSVGSVSGTGNFAGYFYVPQDAKPGMYTVIVQATQHPSITVQVSFKVTVPTITLYPTSGPAGIAVTTTGSGWPEGKDIEFSWDVNNFLGSANADAVGNVTFNFNVPSNASIGNHTVLVNFTNGDIPVELSVIFTVTSASIDLAVTNVQALTQSVCAGSSPNFQADIRNNGTVESGFFNIRWNADGQFADGGHASIPADGTGGYGHIWNNITQGNHSLTFIVDFDNQIPETNENNNQQILTFMAIDCSTSIISGRVTDASNSPISNVTISDGAGHTATSNISGTYTLSGLPAGTYTLTPGKSGYTFSPSSRQASVPPNKTGVNFTGSALPRDSTPPATVTNLGASPDAIKPGSVSLSWTAPGNDGSAGGPAAQYDIRYSTTPINDSNWASALQIDNEPAPASPGTAQTMFTPAVQTGTRWYFALKTTDEAGNWSKLSNTPSLQDIGFRSQINGYQFCNGPTTHPLPCDTGWGKYPNPPANGDFTIDVMRVMYGDSAVCWMIGGTCRPSPRARKFNEMLNNYMNGGHCDGFTITSLRFFKGLDAPSSLQAGANVAHDLVLSHARHNIAYYYALQADDPVTAAREDGFRKTPSQILDQLRLAMSGNISDPTSLIIAGSAGQHSITPYALQEQSSGIWWVYVYDSNHPDDAARHLDINTAANTWSYDLGIKNLIYSGSATSHSLSYVPISKYQLQPGCPWCMLPQSKPESQVWLRGRGHLLLHDSQGRRIGYIGNQLVEEIPGAFATNLAGVLDISQEPIYHVPISAYTLELDGQTVTTPDSSTISQFGPGYAVTVDNVSVEPSTKDQLTIAMDGTQISYQSNTTKSATFTLALGDTTKDEQFQIQGADIGSGQTVRLLLDKTQGRLAFSNAQAGDGLYNLAFQRVSPTGNQNFFHANIVLAAGDTNYVNFAGWNGSGSIALQIDHGSDGTIDQTVMLTAQTPHIYLPLVLQH